MNKEQWLEGVRVWTEEDERYLEKYLSFAQRNLEKIELIGKARDGDIQILTEKVEARNALLAFRQHLQNKPGGSFLQAVLATQVGVMFEDGTAILVRFPALFPAPAGDEKVPGTYLAFYFKSPESLRKLACWRDEP